MHHINVIKANGNTESFNPSKLVASLVSAGADISEANKILELVLSEADGLTLPTARIYKRAFRHLHEMEHPAAIRYSMRRAVAELGPDGFAFEKFFAHILQTRGYETVVDQTIYGKCIPHEVDVVAWKEPDELVVVESKFHNEYGFKTDIKVALYVKARFDDLMGNKFKYGNSEKALTSGWLVTNTKFTEVAIKYALCNDMNLIGWNYPAKGNLQDLIEQSGIRPVTILSSLSISEIRKLIREGIVQCNDIEKLKVGLKNIGFSDDRISITVKEAESICSEPSQDFK